MSFASRIIEPILYAMVARTAEVGCRTLVLDACAGSISHGEYMSDGYNQVIEPWIYTGLGSRAQKKVFEQTIKLLEIKIPGFGGAIGL